MYHRRRIYLVFSNHLIVKIFPTHEEARALTRCLAYGHVVCDVVTRDEYNTLKCNDVSNEEWERYLEVPSGEMFKHL